MQSVGQDEGIKRSQEEGGQGGGDKPFHVAVTEKRRRRRSVFPTLLLLHLPLYLSEAAVSRLS